MANYIDDLISAYEKVVKGNWATTLSGQERIWFLVYTPDLQRKVDFRLADFESTTKKAGKNWVKISFKNCFPEWMAAHEYREDYFQDPEALIDQLEFDFKNFVINQTIEKIKNLNIDDKTVVVFTEVAALFGFTRLSDILNNVASNVKGRLLVFFPGEFDNNHFRLLDARDGWSYLARPITVGSVK
jgi:hypothetical protein